MEAIRPPRIDLLPGHRHRPDAGRTERGEHADVQVAHEVDERVVVGHASRYPGDPRRTRAPRRAARRETYASAWDAASAPASAGPASGTVSPGRTRVRRSPHPRPRARSTKA